MNTVVNTAITAANPNETSMVFRFARNARSVSAESTNGNERAPYVTDPSQCEQGVEGRSDVLLANVGKIYDLTW